MKKLCDGWRRALKCVSFVERCFSGTRSEPITFNTNGRFPFTNFQLDVVPKTDYNGYPYPWPFGGGVNKFNKDGAIEHGFFGSPVTLTGAAVTFADGVGSAALNALSVAVEPSMSGEGTPSPSNIRRISPRYSVYIMSDGTYAISIGQAVYGGTLDVTNGTFTVEYEILTFDGTTDFTMPATGRFRTTLPADAIAPSRYAVDSLGWCSHYNLVTDMTNTEFYATDFCTIYCSSNFSAANKLAYFTDSRFTTLAAFKQYLADQATAGTPVQYVFKLATPYTITLTPTVIETVEGQNTFRSDSGDITLTYVGDTSPLTSPVYANSDCGLIRMPTVANEAGQEQMTYYIARDVVDDPHLAAGIVRNDVVEDIVYGTVTGDEISLSLPVSCGDEEIAVWLYADGHTEALNTLRIMRSLPSEASALPTEWYPYENEGSAEGRTQVEADLSGHTVIIPFGRWAYAGTADAITGKAVFTHGIMTLDGIENRVTSRRRHNPCGDAPMGYHFYMDIPNGYRYGNEVTGAGNTVRAVDPYMASDILPIRGTGPYNVGAYIAWLVRLDVDACQIDLYFPAEMGITTVAEANQWLLEHHPKFIYHLRDSIVTDIPKQNIKTLAGENTLYPYDGTLYACVAYEEE